MSAFLVSAATLANAVQAAIDSGVDLSSIASPDSPTFETDIAKAFYAVNKNAVANRYREEEELADLPDGFTLRLQKEAKEFPRNYTFTSLQCLSYQCNEELSLEHKKVLGLIEEAEENLLEMGLKADHDGDAWR